MCEKPPFKLGGFLAMLTQFLDSDITTSSRLKIVQIASRLSVALYKLTMSENPVIVILYTTLYRKGGGGVSGRRRNADGRKTAAGFEGEIVTQAVESKREVLHVFRQIEAAQKKVVELHFVGHSGMYGPMSAR